MRVIIIVFAAAVTIVGLGLTRSGPNAPVSAAALVKPLADPGSIAQQPADKSAVGTLDQVDTAHQQVTVATSTGKLVFQVVPGATIRQGSKTLKAADLSSHKGERVKVRYRDAGGQRRADWIVLAAAPRRPVKPSKS